MIVVGRVKWALVVAGIAWLVSTHRSEAKFESVPTGALPLLLDYPPVHWIKRMSGNKPLQGQLSLVSQASKLALFESGDLSSSSVLIFVGPRQANAYSRISLSLAHQYHWIEQAG